MPTKAEIKKCTLDVALIGKRVKAARKEKRLTQEELAGLCDCTPTHICNIENGKIGISLDLLFKISILLEKSMDYFVMDNPNVAPQMKINAEIAPKLLQCNPQMLDIIDTILDKLIQYRKLFPEMRGCLRVCAITTVSTYYALLESQNNTLVRGS